METQFFFFFLNQILTVMTDKKDQQRIFQRGYQEQTLFAGPTL
jgi:hypothetical protein